MDQKTITIVIIGMAVVTYLPRLLPAWLLSSRTLPPVVDTWLHFVPVAVLSALLMPSLVMPEGKIDFTWNNLYLWAAVPTMLVAWKTRSLFGTLLTGMGIVALVRWFIA